MIFERWSSGLSFNEMGWSEPYGGAVVGNRVGGGGVWRLAGGEVWRARRESKKSRSVAAVLGNSSTSRGSPLSLGDD